MEVLYEYNVTGLPFSFCTADHVGQLHVIERASAMYAQHSESALKHTVFTRKVYDSEKYTCSVV